MRCSCAQLRRYSSQDVPEAVEAPVGGRPVERLPVPLDDDHPAAGRQRTAHRIGYVTGILDVVQGRRGDDRGRLRRPLLETLELDPAILGALGRLRVDAERLVAVGEEHRHVAADGAAAELDH